MKPINFLFTLILISVIAAGISVSGQTPSQPTAPNSPEPRVTPTPTVPNFAVPDILKDPVLLQQILSKLQAETLRADLKTREAEDLKMNRDEWKQTASLEKQRADKLQEAESLRGKESGALQASIGFLRTSVDEYKVETSDLRRENDKLRGSRKWYLGTGLVLGGAACVAIKR